MHFATSITSLLSVVLACVFSVTTALDNNNHWLFKREYQLPYSTLPNSNCTTPSVCSNINQPVTCRCSDLLTVCQNSNRQFCWGSQTLTQSSGCPSVPESCASEFNGTASCLCNSNTLLCVDAYDHYCYGHFQSGAASTSVSLSPLDPSGSNPAATSSSSAAASSSSSSQAGAQSNSPSAANSVVASLSVLVVAVFFGISMNTL